MDEGKTSVHSEGNNMKNKIIALAVLTAVFTSTAALADDVLIVGSYGDAGTQMKSELEAAGHTVTEASSLPADISNIEQIWDLRINNAISNADQAIYDTFLQNSGYLYLAGENSSFATRNNSISAFTSTLGGGAVSVGGSPSNAQDANSTYFSSDTSVDFIAAATITNTGGTGRVLASDSNGNPTGMIWIGNAGDFSSEYNGTVVVIADINWTQGNYYDANNQVFLQELIGGVVAGTVEGTIDEDGNGGDNNVGGNTPPSDPVVVSTSDPAAKAGTTPTDSDTDTTVAPSTDDIVVTPSADYTTRSGSASESTTETRTTTTQMEVVDTYDDNRTQNRDVDDSVETTMFTQTITTFIDDVMTRFEKHGRDTWISEGIDEDTISVTSATLATSVDQDGAMISATVNLEGTESFTVPTTFYYDRTVSQQTDKTDFADGSEDEIGTNQVISQTDTSDPSDDISAVYNVAGSETETVTGGYRVVGTLRTDAIETVNVAQDIANRGLTFGSINATNYNHSQDGYSGSTTVFGVGGETTLDNGVTLGSGLNKVSSSLSGNNSSVSASTIQLGTTISNNVGSGTFSSTLQHSMTDYESTTSIGWNTTTFGDDRLYRGIGALPTLPATTITGETKGTDSSVALRYTGNGEQFRPIVGYTYGKRKVDGYDANISILGLNDTIKVGSTNDDYSYATVGGELSLGLATITALHHTDGVNQFGIGIEKNTDKVTWNLGAERTLTDIGDSNSISAGLAIRF